MTHFTTFDEADWEALAGAERFADGTDPLVCYDVTIDALPTVIVLDGRGLRGQVLVPGGDEIISNFWATTEEALRWLATRTGTAYDTGALIDAGFIFRAQVMSAKRGDWRTIDGIWYLGLEQARAARDEFAARNQGRRTRIKTISTLGYSVQTFVERKS